MGTTTAAERHTPQMYTADLAAASDQIAQDLVQDLQRLSDQDFSGYRVTVILGDIENKSGTMSTSEFEFVRSRIKGKLMQSADARDNLKFVAGRSRTEELNRREFGPGEKDLLGEGRGRGTGIERDDPAHTYYLNGEAFGIHRGSTRLFSITFELHRAGDGEIVFNRMYEQKYAG